MWLGVRSDLQSETMLFASHSHLARIRRFQVALPRVHPPLTSPVLASKGPVSGRCKGLTLP